MTKPELIAFVIAPLWVLILCGGLAVAYLRYFRKQPAAASSSGQPSTYRLTLSHVEFEELLGREVGHVSNIVNEIKDQEFRTELFMELEKVLTDIQRAESEPALNKCYDTLRFLKDLATGKTAEEAAAARRSANQSNPAQAKRSE